jgi:hypothetical protein
MRNSVSPTQLFLWCLAPRLLFAVMFSAAEYLGSGGDAHVYHVLGVYAKDLMTNPAEASLEPILERWWADDESIYAKYSASLDQVEGGLATAASTTLPIILAHAAAYWVWDNPFSFVLLTSMLSALVHVLFLRGFGIGPKESRWFVLNPASIFFAATHYKESLAESVVMLVMYLLHVARRRVAGVLAAFSLVIFRVSYLPLMPVLLLTGAFEKISPRLIVCGVFLLFALLPSFYWDLFPDDAGPIYSLVYSNEITRRLLGPVVGMLMPMPFIEAPTDPFGIMLSAYGIVYWLVMPTVLIHVLLSHKPDRFAVCAVLISLAISYYVLGGVAAKARFFAPFFPIMLLAFVRVRTDLTRAVRTLLMKRQVPATMSEEVTASP